jgi:hypothetical protein
MLVKRKEHVLPALRRCFASLAAIAVRGPVSLVARKDRTVDLLMVVVFEAQRVDRLRSVVGDGKELVELFRIESLESIA